MDHSVGVDKIDFKELCPAFIQQVKSKACIASIEKPGDKDKDMTKSKLTLFIPKIQVRFNRTFNFFSILPCK